MRETIYYEPSIAWKTPCRRRSGCRRANISLRSGIRGGARSFGVGAPKNGRPALRGGGGSVPGLRLFNEDAPVDFLNGVADEIEARADAITQTGTEETGLPEALFEGERGRTSGQFRLFARHILYGDFLDRRRDEPLSYCTPLSRPDRLLPRLSG